MAEAESKRQRRTPQERANELDEKITKINQSINELEEKKKTVVEEYDAKITAAKERIKSLEAENSRDCEAGNEKWYVGRGSRQPAPCGS